MARGARPGARRAPGARRDRPRGGAPEARRPGRRHRRAHARAGDLPRLLGMSLLVGASGFSFASWRPGFYPAGTRSEDFLRLLRRRAVDGRGQLELLPPAEPPRRSSAGRPPCPTAFASRSRCRARSRSSGASTTRRPSASACARWATASGRCSCARPTTASATTASCARCSTASTTTCGRPSTCATPPGTASRSCSRAATRCASTSSTRPRPSATCACASRPTTTRPCSAWADRLRPLLDDGLAVHCYFMHEDEPTAPAYARRLLELVDAAIAAQLVGRRRLSAVAAAPEAPRRRAPNTARRGPPPSTPWPRSIPGAERATAGGPRPRQRARPRVGHSSSAGGRRGQRGEEPLPVRAADAGDVVVARGGVQALASGRTSAASS